MSVTPLRASCLCGSVRWEVDGPLADLAPGSADRSLEALLFFSHCHCGRCRKAHGAAYASYLVVPAERFRLVTGLEAIAIYRAAPGSTRPFCSLCGSVVPDGVASGGRVGMPAGCFDDTLGVRPTAHIFVASKAPWHEIHDALPRSDAYPPGIAAPFSDRVPLDPPEVGVRGSCLCGGVSYAVTVPPLRSRTCHCSRCRKAGSAANVSYLVVPLDGLEFLRGPELVRRFKVPGARYFEHAFCATCGSSLPRASRERGIHVVPMGTLDDDPGVRPEAHIFVASKADWDEIADPLPRHDEYPPG
ncbi:MAG: GFA family protein [Polyangiaceae bacterium]|nr:GFA family protein [Polyangiaceae bacterium]